MLSLKATTFWWFCRSVSESLAILSVNCSFTLVDRLNVTSGCWVEACRNVGRVRLIFYIFPIKSRQVFSDLCCDLLYDVNKVVYFPVQLGTLQNHLLHLFDGRVHFFICDITTHALTLKSSSISNRWIKSTNTRIKKKKTSAGLLLLQYWLIILDVFVFYIAVVI